MSSSRWLMLAGVLAVSVVGSGCGEVEATPLTELDAPRSVVASTDDPNGVTVSWMPPVRTEGLTGYLVFRDGFQIARVAQVAPRRLVDTLAPEGSFGMPRDLTAASDIEGVRLAWSPASVKGPATARYTVRAAYGVLTGPASSEAVGSRAPAELETYELSRNEGMTWLAVGKGLSFVDRDAPRAEVRLGGAEVQWEDARTLMHLRLKNAPVVGAVPASKYIVRARGKRGVSLQTQPVVGFRAGGREGDLVFQWQRASVDVDSAYRDVPSVTGREWVDRDVRPGKFFWRAVVTSPWAAGRSATASGEAFTFREMSIGTDTLAACGIRNDGQLRCWGSDVIKTGIPAGSFKAVAVGYDHACAIRADDRLICWSATAQSIPAGAPTTPSLELYKSVVSRNDITCGLLLDGSARCFSRAPWVLQPTTEKFKSLVPTSGGACGVRLDDTLFCWGPAPEAVPTATGTFKAIDAESYYGGICAIRSDDKVVCWNIPSPPSTSSFRSVSVSSRCGLRTDGERECWGPTGFSGPTAFKTLFGGYRSGCGITLDDRISCWGIDSQSTPTGPTPRLPFLESARGMAVAREYSPETCYLTATGRVVCEGYVAAIMPPALFKDTFQWVGHTCALASDQHALCWGDATQPPASARFTRLFDGWGSRQTCGIDTAGKLSCWGAVEPREPLLGPAGPTADIFKSVAIGTANVAAIRSDNQVVEWRDRGPTDGELVGIVAKAVTVGAASHRCYINLDDTATCTGLDRGNLPALSPPAASKFTTITIGPSGFACGVRTDGKLECWGRGFADLPDVTGTETFKNVYLRNDGACALRNDDKLVCWGNATSSLPTLAFIPSAGAL
ncbi:MAG: hypothetical protein HOO96_21365 [Polyangiaceae bacterium]|nr:hypothetical protein [Polyangiaceae bacterium]